MLAWLVMFSLGGLVGESEVPTVCQPQQETALDTAARLHVTMCAAQSRMASLTHLVDSEVSTRAVEIAAAPTFAILDDVIATESPQWQMVALELRGDLYMSMAVQMRHANASSWRVTPWLARARIAYSAARTMADAHPEVSGEKHLAERSELVL